MPENCVLIKKSELSKLESENNTLRLEVEKMPSLYNEINDKNSLIDKLNNRIKELESSPDPMKLEIKFSDGYYGPDRNGINIWRPYSDFNIYKINFGVENTLYNQIYRIANSVYKRDRKITEEMIDKAYRDKFNKIKESFRKEIINNIKQMNFWKRRKFLNDFK